MITSISPVTENCQKIKIDDYVRLARISLKRAIVEAHIGLSGQEIKLRQSKTRYGGERIWFECPKCKRRKGVLYRNLHNVMFTCRLCIASPVIIS